MTATKPQVLLVPAKACLFHIGGLQLQSCQGWMTVRPEWDQLWWAWQSINNPTHWTNLSTLETVQRKSCTPETVILWSFFLNCACDYMQPHPLWMNTSSMREICLLWRQVCVRAWDDLQMRENHAQCMRLGRSAIGMLALAVQSPLRKDSVSNGIPG